MPLCGGGITLCGIRLSEAKHLAILKLLECRSIYSNTNLLHSSLFSFVILGLGQSDLQDRSKVFGLGWSLDRSAAQSWILPSARTSARPHDPLSALDPIEDRICDDNNRQEFRFPILAKFRLESTRCFIPTPSRAQRPLSREAGLIEPGRIRFISAWRLTFHDRMCMLGGAAPLIIRYTSFQPCVIQQYTQSTFSTHTYTPTLDLFLESFEYSQYQQTELEGYNILLPSTDTF